MFFSSLCGYLILFTSALAWLPGEHKQITSDNGVDLFNRSSLHSHGHIHKRYLPNAYGNDKNAIRGVNLGSLFVVENWMSDTIFSSMDCTPTSEFDCVSSLHSQSIANTKFASHWSTWITESDFTTMISYGLNTVRIPVGYWLLESLVNPSEHFPQGGAAHLDDVVGYAKAAGMYVIIDLHGAPGAQVTNSFTGQLNPTPDFYNDYNYNRTYAFFHWLTNRIHTYDAYCTVGMVMLVNEPERTWDTTMYPNAAANAQSMRENYYPAAWSTIRDAESALNVSDSQKLHIQMMYASWGSGDPAQYLPDTDFAAYDDHSYIFYTGIPSTQAAYLSHSCTTNKTSDTPLIVGEWSLSVPSAVRNTPAWSLPATQQHNTTSFYRSFWATQVTAYERVPSIGWCFWTWKTSGLDDPRWDYQLAVAAGIIDKNIDAAYDIAAGACEKVKGGGSSSSNDGGWRIRDEIFMTASWDGLWKMLCVLVAIECSLS